MPKHRSGRRDAAVAGVTGHPSQGWGQGTAASTEHTGLHVFFCELVTFRTGKALSVCLCGQWGLQEIRLLFLFTISAGLPSCIPNVSPWAAHSRRGWAWLLLQLTLGLALQGGVILGAGKRAAHLL